MTDNNRRFSRIPFNVRARLTINELVLSCTEISNLSVGGCLLPLSVDAPPATLCQLVIMLEGTSEETSVTIEGEIVRTTQDGLAIKFLRIDPDSLFHLHNIIRYNAPDADAIEQEISRHPGLR